MFPHRHDNLISLVPTRSQINTSSFWSRSPTYCVWAEAVWFDCRFTRTTYWLMLFWTRLSLTLGMSTSVSIRPSWQQSYIAMSCGNNTRVEGLDVTLDNPAGFMRTDPGEWSDGSAWFIRGWITSFTARTPKNNNNDYDYNQALGEKQTGWRQYIIPGSEV